MERKLVAAIACRNQGSRLYGKPIQNLDVGNGIRIVDNIIACLQTIPCIGQIVLGISEGMENEVFVSIAKEKGLDFIIGDQIDVLGRLVQCARIADATDIFRVTSESPFPYFEAVAPLWERHVQDLADASFIDDIIDGCGFEIITREALEQSHHNGDARHRSELCSLFIRENYRSFRIVRHETPPELVRKDLRLTVDNPEDLVVCRIIYKHFQDSAPRIPVVEIVRFLDSRPELIELVLPYTEFGYSTMYCWGKQ